MLVYSLVLSLATLQIAQASCPNPGRPQYGSLGKHGGVATEVRAHNPQVFSLAIETIFLNPRCDNPRR